MTPGLWDWGADEFGTKIPNGIFVLKKLPLFYSNGAS